MSRPMDHTVSCRVALVSRLPSSACIISMASAVCPHAALSFMLAPGPSRTSSACMADGVTVRTVPSPGNLAVMSSASQKLDLRVAVPVIVQKVSSQHTKLGGGADLCIGAAAGAAALTDVGGCGSVSGFSGHQPLGRHLVHTGQHSVHGGLTTANNPSSSSEPRRHRLTVCLLIGPTYLYRVGACLVGAQASFAQHLGQHGHHMPSHRLRQHLRHIGLQQHDSVRVGEP